MKDLVWVAGDRLRQLDRLALAIGVASALLIGAGAVWALAGGGDEGVRHGL